MSIDHRELGRSLDLFATHPDVGSGLPLWLPDGAVIRAELERFAAEQAARAGSQHVYTPVLAKRALFERSGHWGKFADDMFPPMRVGGEEFVLRPANCPHHALVYASQQRSYRDLPVRLSELAPMFRSELSGVLGGLSRVRQINLDDTHVFCAPEQIADEVESALRQIRHVYDVLGIEVAYLRLSRRGEAGKYLGDAALWERCEEMLRDALAAVGAEYVEAPGEAAFYGPKIDIEVRDSAGREESLSTVQLDFNQPERFDLRYVAADGSSRQPVMIHRGVMSAMERLVAHLIELYDGAFPVWLAPVQLAILPVGEAHAAVAGKIYDDAVAAGLRADVVGAEATVAQRIRRAHERRVPYVAVVGDREVDAGQVALRLRDGRRRNNVDIGVLLGELSRVSRERSRDLGFSG
ncbi:threonine--tRNA ligase [Phytoactinopolyspora halotolerans]|uniref:Threonine--tRNA ligase n=1 Tax=Phytoactinopolyspora halotolerans TaxID=1981512 RepID=A0A6L9S2C7_9ACTN|nr:threonine--tRNA ligase [Phytoactinopolyspora halotolerans]NED98587.1 threonine--tRNA ligase [Phytoactinopolyspora halotolerans]